MIFSVKAGQVRTGQGQAARTQLASVSLTGCKGKERSSLNALHCRGLALAAAVPSCGFGFPHTGSGTAFLPLGH